MTNSTDSSHPKALNISSKHVRQQFSRAGRPQSAAFLHQEVAQRMRERLKLIRLQPTVVLDAGCGTGNATPLLRERFPENFQLISQDHHPGMIQTVRKDYRLDGVGQWFARMKNTQKHLTTCSDLAQSGLAPESIDLIWSNLALHWHPEPHEVIREWGRILKPEGLAFFSCYGPATFQELRRAVTAANLQTQTMPFVDMHDFGDMLIEHGFADPVMDQETLTLTYRDSQSLLRDVRALGGNATTTRRAQAVGRQWLDRLHQVLESERNAQGLLTLTVEINYGHAWRKAIRRQGNATQISLQSITRKASLKP